MLVKICGITREEDARACATAGADMLGFVFAESRRKVLPAQAGRIISCLPGHVSTVGVFQDQSADEVVGIALLLGLDYIQLHGDESPDFCTQLMERTGIRIIKAVGVVRKEDLAKAEQFDLDSVSHILLDSRRGANAGGTGRTFPWDLVDESRVFTKPLIVAGGLTCENVHEAIRRLSPAGVDVSTGVEVESSPGIKDISKVRRFISAAKKHTA